MYELLKLLSKVIRREHPSESINSFITDKEIDKSFDTERRIKTKPLIEKLTRKKRKLISVRLRILCNSLFTLYFVRIKSLRICKEKNFKKLLHSFLDNYIIDSDFLDTCIGTMLDKKNVLFLKRKNFFKLNTIRQLVRKVGLSNPPCFLFLLIGFSISN